MNSIYDFIVTPTNERYNNKIKVGDKTLIVNSNIEDHKMVSRHATVVSVPLAYKTVIKKGDEIIIHHNIFRRWYDVRGKERNSSQYFKKDLYFCKPDQIYLYKKDNKWLPFMNRCFVMPIKETNNLTVDIEKKCVGILKIGNNELEAYKIYPGDLVGYKPGREWEFIIDGKRIYCMKSNDIVIKYEYKGNEKEYNPSWANSN
jgi:co-chaperonin GroES (HSP10)